MNKFNLRSIINILIGMLLAIFYAKHAVVSIVHIDISKAVFSLLLFLVLFYALRYEFRKISKYLLELDHYTIFLLLSFSTMMVYVFLSYFINGIYDVTKLLDSIVIMFSFFLALLIPRSSIRVFFFTFVIIGFLSALLLLVNRNYVYASGLNYILISLNVSLCAFISMLKSIDIKISFIYKLLYFVISITCFSALLLVQSRFVFIFSLISVLILVPIFLIKQRNFRLLLVFCLLFSFLLIFKMSFIVDIYQESRLFNRMDSLINNFSSESRFEVYQRYFDQLDVFLFSGLGIGGTEHFIYSSGKDKYPHNIVLEFYSEFGFLGGGFIIYFLVYSMIWILKNIRNEINFLCLLYCYVFYLANFMKSFSIYQSSVLFISFALLVGYVRQERYFRHI